MNVASYLEELKKVAAFSDWKSHGTAETLLFFHQSTGQAKGSLYISAGIHGDEPAGPWAVLELMKNSAWANDLDLWIFPLLNPEGLAQGTRENGSGLDLNRDYNGPQSLEISRHVQILQTLPRFDATVCLHEDWEASGCYLYYLRDDPRANVSTAVLEAMSRHIPIETSPCIDGFEAQQGRIERTLAMVERTEWPEALYLARHHSDCCLTLETPSAFDLAQRVRAHVAGVQALAARVAGS
jgi:murein peptide amidase A